MFCILQIGGYASHFLLSKDGRKPLSCDILKALLPTDSEAPKLDDDVETDIREEEGGDEEDSGTGPEISNGNGVSNGKSPSKDDDDDFDSGSLYEPELEKARMRRASEAELEYCGGFEYKSAVCAIL